MTNETWREELQNKIQIKVKRLDELVNGNGFVCRQEELIKFIQSEIDKAVRDERERWQDGVKHIESLCDNTNDSHETMWRVAHSLLKP